MTIQLKRAFLAHVDNNRPMKVLMRAFDMTKEEVEWHFAQVSRYRMAVESFDQIRAIHKDKSLSNEEKLSRIKEIQNANGTF